MRNTRIGRFTRGFFYTTFAFHFLAFFFGACLFSFDTFLFALLLTTTTFLPLNISCKESVEKFWNCWDNRPQTLFQLYSIRVALGSLIGSWIGVFVVPLDWNRWWQRWPICSFFGLFVFSIIGALTAYFRLFTNYPFIKAILKMFPTIVAPKARRPSEIDDQQQQQQIPSDNNTTSKSIIPTEITSSNIAVERYFRATEPPKLRAIIFAEFDNDIGRVLRFQIPCQVFDKQRFESISSAIIPSEEMRGRMINVNMFENKIIGYPVGIKDKKYPREVLIFNMCFVVSKQVECDWVYEPLVQKCAEYLIELEKERLFISEEKLRLPVLMREIFLGLNNKGECFYTITERTTIYLKLFSNSRGLEPPLVSPFSVPIFTRIPPPISQEQIERMDVLSQKICPQIDGIRCVKDIACFVKIDTDLVARCIRNLCFYGCIRLLPMFLYFNCYIPTKKIRYFIESCGIVERCQRFSILDSNLPIAKSSDIFRLYLGLKHGLTLHSWFLLLNPRQLNIDERKLIQFGVYHGFIRKLNIFPVSMYEDGTKISSLCTGEYSLDDLALRYVCSPVELHKRLALNGNFQFIYR